MQCSLIHERNVRPSVTRVICEKSETKVCQNFYTYKVISSSFLTELIIVEGRHPSTRNFESNWHTVGAKTPILNRYSVVATQPYQLAKSSINTNRKFTMRFPTSLRWTLYDVDTLPLSPQEWGFKNAKAVFPLKLHFTWRKSTTKFVWMMSATVTEKCCYLNLRSKVRT